MYVLKSPLLKLVRAVNDAHKTYSLNLLETLGNGKFQRRFSWDRRKWSGVCSAFCMDNGFRKVAKEGERISLFTRVVMNDTHIIYYCTERERTARWRDGETDRCDWKLIIKKKTHWWVCCTQMMREIVLRRVLQRPIRDGRGAQAEGSAISE